MRPGTVAHARAWRERTAADAAAVAAYAAAYAQACLAERAETVDDVPRNCWTCRHNRYDFEGDAGCAPAQRNDAIADWATEHCDDPPYMPPKDAPPCPGYEAKP